MVNTVLITGATGNIGTKLSAHLREAGGFEVRCICLNPAGEAGIHTADLAVYDESWANLFEGVDTVVHLAADADPHAGWASLQRHNLDLLFNVVAACQQKAVRKLVYASSNHVLGGYRFTRDRLTSDMEPRPGNAYGATKLMGERLGKMLHERYGIAFIAFRIGAFPVGENSRVRARFNASRWGLGMWVSDRDLLEAFRRAINNGTVGFGIYNLVSANPGGRWDLASLERDFGFVPKDGVPTSPSLRWRIKERLAWLRFDLIPRLAKLAARRHW